MDLSLYARVIWRFRLLVVLGFIAAVALAFISYARVSFKNGVHVTYRQSETWQAQTRLLIAQPGFPQGALVPSQSSSSDASGTTPSAPADLTGTAGYYQLLANGDAVQSALARDSSVHGTMQAQQVMTDGGRSGTPILAIDGAATTAADAVHVARQGAAVFAAYVQRLQEQNHIPASNRVQVDVLNQAVVPKAELLAGRKKTLPIVVFVTVLAAALGLAFILENLRPRIHALPSASAPHTGEPARERLGA